MLEQAVSDLIAVQAVYILEPVYIIPLYAIFFTRVVFYPLLHMLMKPRRIVKACKRINITDEYARNILTRKKNVLFIFVKIFKRYSFVIIIAGNGLIGMEINIVSAFPVEPVNYRGEAKFIL